MLMPAWNFFNANSIKGRMFWSVYDLFAGQGVTGFSIGEETGETFIKFTTRIPKI